MTSPFSRRCRQNACPQHDGFILTRFAPLVFVGNTAALSFLRFLQRTLKYYVGPSGFTNRQHSHDLFELASSDADGGSFCDDLDQAEKSILIRCYLDAVRSAPCYMTTHVG